MVSDRAEILFPATSLDGFRVTLQIVTADFDDSSRRNREERFVKERDELCLAM